MKTIFLFLLFACSVFSMPDVSALNTFQDSAVITATPFNKNFDTLKTYINKNRDTLETKFIRFTDLSSGDSTIKTDSQYNRTIKSTGVIYCDSLSVRAIDGHFSDSIEARKGIHGPLLNATNIIGDSVFTRTLSTSGSVSVGSSGSAFRFTVDGSDNSLSHLATQSVFKNTLATRGDGTTTYNRSGVTVTSATSVVYGGMFSTYESGGTFGNSIAFGSTDGGSNTVIVSNSLPRITVLNAGNVGVGVATPSEKLDVTGGNVKADTIKAVVSTSQILNSGYTRLGAVSDSAPIIKIKKLSHVMGSGASVTTNFAHGLTGSKILSISARLAATASQWIKENDAESGGVYQFVVDWDGTTIYLINGSLASSITNSMVCTLTIIYEQ